MKPYLILKPFKGTQDGFGDGELFVAGTTRALSPSLVQALGGVNGGFVKDAEAVAEDIAQAHPALADAVLDAIADAESPDAEAVAEEEKAADAAPENAANPAAPENKAKGGKKKS